MTFVPCRAALLAYEGFDYTAGGDLMGLSGGAGWSGGWQAVQGGAGVLINTGSLDATGISPSGYAARATGNSALVNNGHRSGRFLDCSAGGTFGSHGYIDGNGRIGAGGKVLYISFLQQGTETGDYYEFEFHRDNLDDPGRIGGVCGQGDIYLRTPNNTIHIVNADTALHFFVIKVVFNANGNDDFYVYNDPTGTAESDNAPTLVATGQGNFSFNGISISAFGGSVNHFSDQIRLGETWTDVVGGPAGFTLQPGTVIANVGDAAPLTAQAVSDLAINYQWYKNGSLLSGATATTLSFPSLALSDNGNYTLVASNALGSATSTVAAVTVINTNNDTLLVYEGFSYSAGPLIGQNGGAGWSGAWQNVANSGGTVINGSLVAGANSPSGYDGRSTGNSVSDANSRAGRNLDTSAGSLLSTHGFVDGLGHVGADGKILYVSFMQQSSVVDGSAYYEFELHRGNLSDPGRMGGIGNDAGDNHVHLRSEYPASAGSTMFDLGVGTTDVNFYVMKIVYKSGGDDVYVYRNPTGATESANVPVLTALGLPEMSFDGISLGAFNGGVIETNDQIRLGESWSSVVGGPPGFIVEPVGFVAHAGDSNALTASAISDQSISYQWLKNGSILTGATNSTLTLGNIILSSGGNYSLIASNSLGSVTSVVAAVSVINDASYLLSYEGFDYPSSANLLGLNGGAGWNGGWVDVGGGGGATINGSGLNAGANAPSGYDARATGKSLFLANDNRFGRFLDVSTNGTFGTHGLVDSNGRIGADGTSLYISFLQQPNSANGTVASFYEFEFHRDDLGDPGRMAGVGTDAAFVGTNNASNVYLRAPNGGANLIGLGDTNVNLYVLRIDYVSGADTVYVYRNPTGANEAGNIPVLTLPAVADMSFNGVSLAAYNNGVTQQSDQIRMGLSWGDVIGGPPGFIVQPPKQTTNYTFTAGSITAQAISDLPVNYQWYHTNTLIPGATNATLTIPNLQPSDAGAYYVSALNSLGTNNSTVANLDLVALAFTNQPISQVVYLNGNYHQTTTLTSGAGGFQVTYQWFLNGNPVTGATYSSLVLSNLQVANGGNYFVVATSGSGSVTSSVASLTVYGVNNNVFVYDGFNYPGSTDGSTLIDGASQNGGIGWSGPWLLQNGNAVNVALGSLQGNAAVPNGFDYRSTGNSIEDYGQCRTGRFFDTSTNSQLSKQGFVDGNGNVGADGKTIYLSFLQQTSTTSGGLFYELEFKRGTLNDNGRIGGIGNDTSSGNVNLRAGGVNNYSLGAGDTGVDFYVVRINYKAGNDDVYVYRNPTSTSEPAVPTLVVSNAADMSFNALSVAAYNGPDLKIDEIRLGATWADAIGLAVSNLLPPTQTANGFTIQFACTPGYTYRIQRAPSLTGPWTDIDTIVAPVTGFVIYQDTTAPAGAGFYRTVTP